MSSRYGRYRTPKARKIRPAVRVRERVAKKGGRCAGCRLRYEAGDNVTAVIVKRKVYHTGACVPANPTQQSPVGSGGPVTLSASQLASALSVKWSFGEAKMVGLLGLENALVVGVNSGTIKLTDEIDTAFKRYNKCKASALRPGSDQEEKTAMVLAVNSLVKMVFNQ